jgi:hypothetical protein
VLLNSLRKGIDYSTATGRMLAAPAAPTHATSSTPFLRASKGHTRAMMSGSWRLRQCRKMVINRQSPSSEVSAGGESRNHATKNNVGQRS